MDSCKHVCTTNVEEIINELENIASFGAYATVLVSDNDPPFNSWKLLNWCKKEI